jgi:hypothetical protein
MNLAPGIPAASDRPRASGTATSSRACMTSVGAVILESSSETSASALARKLRTAFSGEVEMRCNSLNQSACCFVASGINLVVKNQHVGNEPGDLSMVPPDGCLEHASGPTGSDGWLMDRRFGGRFSSRIFGRGRRACESQCATVTGFCRFSGRCGWIEAGSYSE